MDSPTPVHSTLGEGVQNLASNSFVSLVTASTNVRGPRCRTCGQTPPEILNTSTFFDVATIEQVTDT